MAVSAWSTSRSPIIARGTTVRDCPDRPGPFPNRLRSTLCDVATLDPTDEQRRLLERHLDEIDAWNRRVNLTTVPRERAWDRHVAESIALLAAARPAPGAVCADLGSGGGVPGVPAAILRPDMSLVLIESDRRKAGFLVHVCGLLGLTNARVIDRRAEDLARDPAHAGHYDVVISRATAPPPLLWALAEPLLRDEGWLWALVSDADAAVAVSRLRGDPRAGVEQPAPGILAVRKLGA
jgi:16S rRNA (guanine(527)-N(7))-methyltransferase RsmG